jgi:hypothetical protein
MAKKTSVPVRKKNSKKKTAKKIGGRVLDKTPEEPRESFDFGGLPIRDLKKNLGCG